MEISGLCMICVSINPNFYLGSWLPLSAMQLQFWEMDEKSAAGSAWHSFSAPIQYDGHIWVPYHSDSPLSSLPEQLPNNKV